MAGQLRHHELRASAVRELQRCIGQLEAMHARIETLPRRNAGPGELDEVREGTRLAVRSLRRIVEGLREDAW